MTEDLGIKIATKEEKFWLELKEKLESDITNFKRQILLNKYVLRLVERKIKAEKENL